MKHQVGIDIVDNSRIKLDAAFLAKFLSSDELDWLDSFDSDKRKIEFAAGRWAAKEAIIKVMDDNNYLPMNKINIGYNNKKPVILNPGYETIAISISHETNNSVGIAFYIEEK